jgi:hypothetical protein
MSRHAAAVTSEPGPADRRVLRHACDRAAFADSRYDVQVSADAAMASTETTVARNAEEAGFEPAADIPASDRFQGGSDRPLRHPSKAHQR